MQKGVWVEHVYKAFGREHVLKDVNMKIEPGEIFGVVGNNGSGKTVLMKCICGFLQPDQGRIYVDGQQVSKDCDFPDALGVIIETPGFIPDITGYQNLKLLAALKGKIGRKDILATLERVGLDPGMKKPVAKYSLGMRQRLLMNLRQQGKAILLASHNAQDIQVLCDQVHDMEDIWEPFSEERLARKEVVQK